MCIYFIFQKLETQVKEALSAFSQQGLTSIALPPVGTGGLNYPLEEVANTLVNTTVKFLNGNPGSTLKEVCYVSYYQSNVTKVRPIIVNPSFACQS